MELLAQPLGQFLLFIYDNIAFHSYGLALVIFTIIIKLVLLPLTIKQIKSTAKTQQLQPQMAELQKKHKDDKQKLNEEMMKLYKEHNFNPMSGCLPLLIQIPIFLALFAVVSKPLTYILNIGPKVADLVNALQIPKNSSYIESKIINAINSDVATSILGDPISVHRLMEMKANIKFLGINLGLIPSWRPENLFGNNSSQYLLLLLIPILSTAATYMFTKLSTMNSPAPAMADKNTRFIMYYMGTIMTLIFSFQFPAGLGLYWTVGNVFQVFQQLFINKYILKKKEV